MPLTTTAGFQFRLSPNIDLDRWRTEAYRVPAEEAPDPDAPAPQDQEGES